MTEGVGLGEVTAVDDGVRLQFRRVWPHPVEDVWSAITDPGRMARWLGTYDGERRVGGTGTFTMTQEDQSVGERMTIVECDPPRRLVVEWLSEERWRVQLDLEAEGGRTVLLFSQSFASGTDVGDLALGWHWYLDKLGAEVVGAPQPVGWDDFLAATGPAYGRPAPP
jgi:uncharacterized protein YndB with AHSA1/START domain